MSRHRHLFPVVLMSRVLGVSKSGYYKWRSERGRRALRNASLVAAIKSIFKRSLATYGSPRVWIELKKIGIHTSKATVARLMRAHKLRVKPIRRFVHVGHTPPPYRVAGNVLNREFEVSRPNLVWVTDISYILIGRRYYYLTICMDLYNREIVSWTLSADMSASSTSIATLKKALRARQITSSHALIVHSDQGSQYSCKSFVDLLARYGCRASMSRKGNCWDNAVAESFFKTIKGECLNRIKLHSFRQAMRIIFSYIDGWYNTQRIHSYLNGLSPAEYANKNSNTHVA